MNRVIVVLLILLSVGGFQFLEYLDCGDRGKCGNSCCK